MNPSTLFRLLLLAGASGCLGLAACREDAQAPEAKTLEVAVTEMKKEDVVIYQDFVGTVDGMENAEIRARVAGYLEKVHYTEGARVKAGEMLFTIDPVLSQAEVRKSRGDVAMGQASLAKAQADVDRYTPLVATNAVSREQLDHALARKQEASAQILAAQGTLATAQASLSFTHVKAPIDGIVGLRSVSVGTLVGQTEPTLLTTISQLDTVRVRFPISEQLYLEHAALLNLLAGQGEREGRLELVLADGSVYPHRGYLAVVDRAVSISTGSITLEARFPNSDLLLRPGQFARVRAPIGQIKGAIGVLQRAIIERQSMHEVLVLGEGNKVERKAVTVGPKVGSYWIVEKGLEPGDKVLIEGVQKVKPGMVVQPRPVPADPISPPPPGISFEVPAPAEEGSAETDAVAPATDGTPTTAPEEEKKEAGEAAKDDAKAEPGAEKAPTKPAPRPRKAPAQPAATEGSR